MEINFTKLEENLKNYLQTIESEKLYDAFSKAIIFAIEQYHTEILNSNKD